MTNYLVTFYTHSAALKFNKLCQTKAIDSELMPVPRKLSSSCGICARIQCTQSFEELLVEDIDSIYTYSSEEYVLVYQSE